MCLGKLKNDKSITLQESRCVNIQPQEDTLPADEGKGRYEILSDLIRQSWGGALGRTVMPYGRTKHVLYDALVHWRRYLMRKLLALGLAMMMVLAGSSVALAAENCTVTFTVLYIDESAFDDVDLEVDVGGTKTTHSTGIDSNTVDVVIEQGTHVSVHANKDGYEASTNFQVPEASTYDVTIYMVYHDGDTTKVSFEVTDAIGVNINAHDGHRHVRAGGTEFDPVPFSVHIHGAHENETVGGIVKAFTMTGDGNWTVVAADPVVNAIAFEFSPDNGTYVPFNPSGHELADFTDPNWQQDFWLQGLISAETENARGNIYFQVEVSLK